MKEAEFKAWLLARGTKPAAANTRAYAVRTVEKRLQALGIAHDDIDRAIDAGELERIAARMDDPKQGIVQADVYQMMAYGRLYGCGELMLLHPHHRALGDEGATRRYGVTGSEDHLVAATSDLAEPAGLHARLRALVSHVQATRRSEDHL